MKYTPGQTVFFRNGDGTVRKGKIKSVITTTTAVKEQTDYRIEWGSNDGSSADKVVIESNVYTIAEAAFK